MKAAEKQRAKPSIEQREEVTAPRATHLIFDDLAEFDDHALAAVFERAEPHIAFLALAGAPVGLVERIMTQLSPREAKMLRKRIENIGPIRLLDVDLAQRHVAERAVELVEEGRVTVPRKKFSVAA